MQYLNREYLRTGLCTLWTFLWHKGHLSEAYVVLSHLFCKLSYYQLYCTPFLVLCGILVIKGRVRITLNRDGEVIVQTPLIKNPLLAALLEVATVSPPMKTREFQTYFLAYIYSSMIQLLTLRGRGFMVPYQAVLVVAFVSWFAPESSVLRLRPSQQLDINKGI
ncbi:hypothetical protein BDP27DRAFT_1367391 [Rhodocollybia butyracea]|uniref:Uncharacterized protein n=1 Tax=Rhodocollybia butyracea TaxID=206335 RepID=A0A9P5U1Z1_9AGAR|nr:hypothetical protein BDP27DRAFT_1367391 [Rhodocollybia butyracea]